MTEYAESVAHEALVEWLLRRGFAEEKRGYGHVSADELATCLLDKFEIRELPFEGGDDD